MRSPLFRGACWLSIAVVALAAILANRSGAPAGHTCTYYIAADPVTWDYVPSGRDEITGHPFADTAFFRKSPPQPVSTSYRKVLYREYTDTTFSTLKPRLAEWQHLGFLGPVMHAAVGDTIRVVFRNNGGRPYSVHPHGVFYNKDSEGAPYADGTSGSDKLDDGVAPGGTHVYTWPVPERAGPASGEGSSVMWMYHSHTDETRDVNTGLLGVMIVTAREMARPDRSPRDVDREIIASFDQVHEEDSWLAEQNLPADLGKKAPTENPSQRQNFYPWFVKFTVNGFAHGSLPVDAFTFRKGERVRWYLMSSTNDFDIHAPHWHGNTVVAHHMRTDVVSITAMEMLVADMRPDNPGTWLFHCHISFHNAAGMTARYVVKDQMANK
jgi:FtsP/CotA-like multicopper oxidase with cupredoxin domain